MLGIRVLEGDARVSSPALQVSVGPCDHGRPRGFGLDSFVPLVGGQVLGGPSPRLWLQHRGQRFVGASGRRTRPPGGSPPAHQPRGAPGL